MGIRHLTGKGMACCVNALLRCDGLVYVRGLDYRAVLSKGLVGDCGKDFFDVSNEKNCTIDNFVV